MYRQMDIFDFIGKPDTCAARSPTVTRLDQIFEKIDRPVMRCANCLCQYCANNAEEVHHTVRPDEMGEPCFNCDECREFTGESKHRYEAKEHCADFVLSDYGAKKNRKKLMKL